MESRVNKIIEEFLVKMKNDVKIKLTTLDLIQTHEDTQEIYTEKMREFMEYIFEYPKLVISKEYLVVSKKTSSQMMTIPIEMQCIAKRFDGVQCTRKKKKGCDLCGTHLKLETNKQAQTSNIKTLEVSAEDVNGIIYYIDKQYNVYHTEDILEGKHNPRIIGRANKQGDNSYTIDL